MSILNLSHEQAKADRKWLRELLTTYLVGRFEDRVTASSDYGAIRIHSGEGKPTVGVVMLTSGRGVGIGTNVPRLHSRDRLKRQPPDYVLLAYPKDERPFLERFDEVLDRRVKEAETW